MAEEGSALDPNQRAELFFPFGFEKKQFRRRPWPNETYEEAITRARVILWNIAASNEEALAQGAQITYRQLDEMSKEFLEEHPDFPGRSRLLVKEFNNLWRGAVTTLLAMFKTVEEPDTK